MFYCIFDEMHANLVNVRDFFKKNNFDPKLCGCKNDYTLNSIKETLNILVDSMSSITTDLILLGIKCTRSWQISTSNFHLLACPWCLMGSVAQLPFKIPFRCSIVLRLGEILFFTLWEFIVTVMLKKWPTMEKEKVASCEFMTPLIKHNSPIPQNFTTTKLLCGDLVLFIVLQKLHQTFFNKNFREVVLNFATF